MRLSSSGHLDANLVIRIAAIHRWTTKIAPIKRSLCMFTGVAALSSMSVVDIVAVTVALAHHRPCVTYGVHSMRNNNNNDNIMTASSVVVNE